MDDERTGKMAANHVARQHAGTKCRLMDYLGLIKLLHTESLQVSKVSLRRGVLFEMMACEFE